MNEQTTRINMQTQLELFSSHLDGALEILRDIASECKHLEYNRQRALCLKTASFLDHINDISKFIEKEIIQTWYTDIFKEK